MVDSSRIHGPKQVTDAYLLALATANNGRFITFDRSVSLSVVPQAQQENMTVLGG
jgi:predicted nucleic acid-binding protein